MHENRETSETPVVQSDSRSAGESSGRTARVYVSEESHCGIVPMNHSNNDGISSAESEEGRLRIKENFPIRHAPDSERDCACPTGGPSVRTRESMAAIHPR